MNKLSFKSWISFFTFSSLIIFFNPVNADDSTFGSQIFKIQKKHALKGNTLAQYSLGTFIEYGISVKPDPKEAIVWYEKAAAKHHKPAANRIIYLDIKLNGYKESTHNAWVNKINDEASRGNIDSIIILGQLNYYGLGVKKNLPKALKLLLKASSRGRIEVDTEINQLKKLTGKSTTNQKAVVNTKVEKEPEVSKPDAVKTSKPKADVAKKSKPKSVSKNKSPPKKTASKKSKAEKELARRKKYEAALRKQHREELILEQQQEWSEGEEAE